VTSSGIKTDPGCSQWELSGHQ